MSSASLVNPDLLDLAPLVGRVLDVGADGGRFATRYRLRNPACRYVVAGRFGAIDDAVVAREAPFDLIVIQDMQALLADADAVLAKCWTLLASDGHLLLCLPHAGHWRRLAEGADDGAPDPAAPLATLTAVLKRQAFRPLKHRPRKDPPLDTDLEALGPTIERLAATTGLNRAALLDRISVAHHVLVAGRADHVIAQPLQLLISAMAPRMMDVRTRLPARFLNSAPEAGVRYQEKSSALMAVPAGVGRVLILQRPATPDRAAWLHFARDALRQGWLVITEYDDHPELVGKVLGWAPERARWLHIAGAHAVQTTTNPLAAAFRAHNPEVAVFPNAAFALPPLRARAGGPLRIFYGALNRGTFSAAIAQSLAPAIAAHPDLMFEVVHDQSFFDALPTGRKRFSPTLDYDPYLQMVEACDIALLPLAGADFELFKSDVKYVECASRGTAVIASPAVYGDSIADGRTGLIARDLADWAPALRRLIEEDRLRETLVREAWQDVRDHRMFAAQIGPRMAWYRRLWTDRDRLHAELLARCPWLETA